MTFKSPTIPVPWCFSTAAAPCAAGNGTRLTDRVRYALPIWLPSVAERRLHRRFVAPALKAIFDYRASVIYRMFGTERHPQRGEPT